MDFSRIKLPFGKGSIIWSPDNGNATITGRQMFGTNLGLKHYRNGKLFDVRDLGSGLVNNMGTQYMGNDFNWANNCQCLKLANYHMSGTGSTPAAATDVTMQTTTSCPAPVSGTQTFTSGANSSVYQTVATTNYSGSLAITEWGLFLTGTLSASTGTPLTNDTASSATATATPWTASSGTVQGLQGLAIFTGSTAVWGMVLSNTTSVATIPAWYKVSDGTLGSTPGSTEAFTLKPIMFDHQVFSAVNVISGDSIQFTFQLTITPGG